MGLKPGWRRAQRKNLWAENPRYLQRLRTCSTKLVEMLGENGVRADSRSWWGFRLSLRVRERSLTSCGGGSGLGLGFSG